MTGPPWSWPRVDESEARAQRARRRPCEVKSAPREINGRYSTQGIYEVQGDMCQEQSITRTHTISIIEAMGVGC